MVRINFILLYFLFILILSCNKNKTGSELKVYHSENNSWQSIQSFQLIDDINYTATEVPLQYYLLKNFGEDKIKIDSIFNTLKEERIIEFEFQHTNKDDLLLEEYTKLPYEKAVKYMAFKIRNDYKAVTSTNDTIECSGVHFERNFKIAPFKRVMLYFNGIDVDENITLVYDDKLFGNGIIKFNLDEQPIKL